MLDNVIGGQGYFRAKKIILCALNKNSERFNSLRILTFECLIKAHYSFSTCLVQNVSPNDVNQTPFVAIGVYSI